MKKILFNPLSAKSILWTAILAMLAFSKKEEVEFVQDETVADPTDPLGSWKDAKMHETIGSKKQSSPLLIHQIFNDKWQEKQTKEASIAFVCKYMNLDKKKVSEIQKTYLKDNKSMFVLVSEGKTLLTAKDALKKIFVKELNQNEIKAEPVASVEEEPKKKAPAKKKTTAKKK